MQLKKPPLDLDRFLMPCHLGPGVMTPRDLGVDVFSDLCSMPFDLNRLCGNVDVDVDVLIMWAF